MAKTNKVEDIKPEVQEDQVQDDEVKENVEPEVKKEKKAKAPKKYIVYTPVKNYNGTVAGVQFAYGKAEVYEGWILEWFKEKGYKVEEAE